MNWMIVDALVALDEHSLAAEIRQRTLDVVDRAGCFEYFLVADRTRYGASEFRGPRHSCSTSSHRRNNGPVSVTPCRSSTSTVISRAVHVVRAGLPELAAQLPTIPAEMMIGASSAR